MLEEYPDILTSREIREILAVSKELLYELIKTKRIPAYKLGKKEWRFNKAELIECLNSFGK